MILVSYRPSRRSNAPFAPGSVAASYASTIASLYSGKKVLRFGRSARGPRRPPAEETGVIAVAGMSELLIVTV